MRYRYVKSTTSHRNPIVLKLIPIFFLVAGLALVSSAVFPILAYQFFQAPRFQPLSKPVPDDYQASFSSPDPQKAVLGLNSNPDMSKVSNWFSSPPGFPTHPSKITHYTLSIPKLKIDEASVQVGGEDLKKSLIHYQGTAFPGQFGNAVVFGHSVLPQFFNPKNYMTIFSTLPTLEEEDEILVDFDGILYRYLVEEMVEVPPDDISVLAQKYDDSYLILITCTPPGTYLRRLVVRARLTPLQ